MVYVPVVGQEWKGLRMGGAILLGLCPSVRGRKATGN